MTKKELLKRIEFTENNLEILVERVDKYNQFNLDLIEYLELDFKKIKEVKERWFTDDKIIERFKFSKKTKKSKK